MSGLSSLMEIISQAGVLLYVEKAIKVVSNEDTKNIFLTRVKIAKEKSFRLNKLSDTKKNEISYRINSTEGMDFNK